ncbi:AAA family ATPase [Noviherbaspirillum aerium]|uniref:AAA family ATPase n=1 Tax=Noviherbaspirillum aerium TaxID=2588497 RepID=UPI00124E8187|nr:AAA family ATPase [Noviherbaspirillum aerium]
MKILRIAGKNLASLGGEFELDFMQEPLVSAGLFAICGPTGAGKSTLLDALCLALYDATPRLSRAGSKGIGLPDVRDETVTPQDTRNLLRRGSADGYAEVDFIGNDSCCYRARWSVRRARAKADGALQQVVMSLQSLPERQAIGGTNREVKAEIEARIGLNFDQFTRAVLLAQNEFSAFLRADDGDRGELLETLTGTAIYSDMSKRAFERSKSEHQILNAISQRMADQQPLDAQARLELERDCALTHDAMTVLEQRKGELESQLRWHAALQAALRDEEHARLEAERLALISRNMDERRHRLALIEQVQPARAIMDDTARLSAAIESIRAEIEHIETQLASAHRSRQDAELAAGAAEQAHKIALQTLEAALPDIDKAKALDAQIAALVPDNEIAATAVARIKTDKAGIEARMDAGCKALEEANGARQAAERWLSDQASVLPLALQWPRWDSMLKHSALQLDSLNVLEQELAAAREASHRFDTRLAEVEDLLASATRAQAEAEMQRLTCQFESASHSRSAIRQERQQLELKRENLDDGARLWSTLNTARQQLRVLKDEDKQLRSAETEAALANNHVRTEIAAAKAALGQAEKAQVAARIACSDSVKNLRDALEDGLPCPVCGSTEHPYADSGGRLHALLEEFDAEVARCRERVDNFLARQARSEALLHEGQRRLQQISRQMQDAQERVSTAESEWSQHHLSAQANVHAREDVERWLADEIRTVRERLHELAVAESSAEQAAQRLDMAQQTLDAAAVSLRERQTQFDLTMTEARQRKHEVDRLITSSTEANARVALALDELSAAFTASADWREHWRRDPAAFRLDCEQRVQRWQEQCRIRDENLARVAELEASAMSLKEAKSRCDAELQRADAMLEESSRRIAGMRSARAEIFEGRALSVIEDQLAAAVSLAKTAMHAQSMRMQECAIAVARHQESMEKTARRLATLEAEHADSRARLSDWLTHFNAAKAFAADTQDTESLQVLLGYSLEWISAERDELHAAVTAMQTANAILQERTERRTAHEQGRVGSEDANAVSSLLDELMVRFEAVRTDFTRQKIALAEDDSRHEKSVAILDEFERQQEKARLWGQLAELIGSADGKKFRNYAQQFTLDVLLAYANRHLEDLVRRYRLERVKDTLALLVVDQDMGDEIRSIHSLSGGESFLVSLALALGLASLSSNRVRVESLFIDEGFGSLDADTLSIAMHALDSLQSQGRKVGVITHVQEMSERIATKVMVQRVAGGKSLVRIDSESIL